MKSNLFFLVALSAMVLLSCSETTTPSGTTVQHEFPGVGSEYDISWTRFKQDGQRDTLTTRRDTTTILISKDTVVNGRKGAMIFAAGDPDFPGSIYRKTTLRVNRNNDIEILLDDDEITFDQWVILPVESKSAKMLPIDTVNEDGDLHITGTVVSSYQGEATVTIEDKDVKVIKCKVQGDLQGEIGSTVVAMIGVTRTYWYAPSLGYYTYLEELEDGIDVDGDPHFRHAKEEMQRYRLK